MDNINAIFTREEAAEIVEKFEDVLVANDICVPSPEDDERDPDDMLGLYGTIYFRLVDYVESKIKEILERYQNGDDIITDIFYS